MSLTFAELQLANKKRAEYWTNGGPSPGLEFSVIELGGEVGELLNEVKKLLRFRNGMVGGKDNMQDIADELGDVVVCCSLLANKLGMDLGDITARKFNKTSDKHGFPVFINEPPIMPGLYA